MEAKHAEYVKVGAIHQQKLGALMDERSILEKQLQGLDGQIELTRKALYVNQGASQALEVQMKVAPQAEGHDQVEQGKSGPQEKSSS